MQPASTLAQLGAFVADLRPDALPPPALDQLRQHLFDTLVAGLVGAATPDAHALAGTVQDAGAAGPVPVPGLRLRAPAPLAALVTCAATRCTEIDDIHLESCTTPGAVVVPTALALAHARPAVRAETFLAALLAGYEVVTRFGRAAEGPAILYRSVWPTYLAGALGAAATATRLLALSAEQATHALATALTLTAGTSARGSGLPSRWLTLGCAVQNGLLAALGARRGLRSDPMLLDGAWAHTTGLAIAQAPLVADLGAALAISRVSLKPYCAAKQTTGAIAAFLALLDEGPLDPATIERVVVGVPPAYARMIDQPAMPVDRLGSIVSVQYQLALAAYHRAGLADVRRDPLHHEPAFRALMARVQVEPDDDLSRHYPAAWPARVAVHTSTGARTREVRHTLGDPASPMTWQNVLQKAHAVTRGVVDREAVDRLARACRELGTAVPLPALLSVLSGLVSEP